MGGETPATSTVPGAAGGEAEKLSVGRLGLRRVVMCRVDSTLLAWLQSRSGAEAPGAIGEVLAQAVAEGIPSLQSKRRPPSSQSVSAPGDADGGRLVAFTVDSGLVQQLAEIAGDEAPAVVGTTAIAAAMEGRGPLRWYQANLNQEATEDIYPPASQGLGGHRRAGQGTGG